MQQQSLFTDLAINILGIEFELFNGKPWVSTITLAEEFDKRHDNLIEAFSNQVKYLDESEVIFLNIKEKKSRHIGRGRPNIYWLLDEKTAMFFVAGFTDEIGAKARLRLIIAFEMAVKELEKRMTQPERQEFVQKFMCKLGGPHCMVTQIDDLLICDKHGVI